MGRAADEFIASDSELSVRGVVGASSELWACMGHLICMYVCVFFLGGGGGGAGAELREAARTADVPDLQRLLKVDSIDLFSQDDEGNTALHVAAGICFSFSLRFYIANVPRRVASPCIFLC